MHDVTFHLALVAGMFAVTFSSRWIPLALFARITIPRSVETWLRDIPTAIFAAILVQTMFPSDHAWSFMSQLPLLLGCTLALWIGRRTQSMLYGTACGFGGFLLLHVW